MAIVKKKEFLAVVAVFCSLVPLTVSYDECSYPLIERAKLKATTSLSQRGPSNAILNGKNAWTASSSDFSQYLIIDLGQTMNITGIATQGRAHYNEFVMEYGISYGTNGLDYADYKASDGNIKMFKGNQDGDIVKYNKFKIPIIAQWIRINPTRWRDRISLRVELYGCEYFSNVVSFNGSSLIQWDLLHNPLNTIQHSLRFRFKTNNADGILMYSRGSQGDFFALQVQDNKMLLNIDLGSGIMTSLSVGSLLDDNTWHDVIFSRNRKAIDFSVDRVFINGRIKGEFYRLDLNRAFYIGGVPNKQEGLVVNQNFTGCIDNLFFNYTNMIQELKYLEQREENWRYQTFETSGTCPEPPIIPVTFLTSSSYAKLRGYHGVNSMNVSLSFRTYAKEGIILYHEFLSKGYVMMFLKEGKLILKIMTDNSPKITLDNFEETLNDGKWHQVIFTVTKNLLILEVDSKPMKTIRQIEVRTGHLYFIGGKPGNQQRGFIGCMRLIQIDGNYKLPTDWTSDEYCCKNEIVFDACQMIDRCNPNPCEHSGICTQTSDYFECDCSHTGYTGAVCRIPKYPLSCEGSGKSVNYIYHKSEMKIDVDGSGPLRPFPVTCEFFPDGQVLTILHHSNEQLTSVDGFEEPGSYVKDIHYDADLDQITAFINRSETCRQRITYYCKHSKLFNSPISSNDEFQPNSWWVSRNNQKMDYWGGSSSGSRKCECGIEGLCVKNQMWCNCDANLETWQQDSGDITEKEHLPVKQLRFGDTGTPLDEKEGQYSLGPLICEGNDLISNVVTFRIADATINLPTFDMSHSGDIYFEFKTTQENAVILYCEGPTKDFIKVSIINGEQIYFEYKAGNGHVTLTHQITKLADNNWHSVSIERNKRQARISVDGSFNGEVSEPPGPVRALHLTSYLVVGATRDYRDGYVGCIRSLLLNGQLQDLKGQARRGMYGVSVGCIGRCESSPCLNNGTCHERYDGYWCDCRWTAFKGPICADEIGVNLRQNSMIKYNFVGSWRSTIAEKIRVGFTTTNPKGFLLGLFSKITKEYMTIMISNSGHLRVVFDFGFERQEVIFPDKHFGLGQYHDVRVRRKNSGATLVLQVDNYEPVEYNFNIKSSADAQFNNIQYMYIGKNESMTEGFAGCISRVEFDDIYPLKLLFQESGPGNVRAIGGPLTEDFCGVEPITHPPNIVETRPPPDVDEDKVRAAYHETDTAVLGSVVAIISTALFIMCFLISRYISRHKGEYLTQEDKGADLALDPDSAVVNSATGHQVLKKKEWFI